MEDGASASSASCRRLQDSPCAADTWLRVAMGIPQPYALLGGSRGAGGNDGATQSPCAATQAVPYRSPTHQYSARHTVAHVTATPTGTRNAWRDDWSDAYACPGQGCNGPKPWV